MNNMILSRFAPLRLLVAEDVGKAGPIHNQRHVLGLELTQVEAVGQNRLFALLIPPTTGQASAALPSLAVVLGEQVAGAPADSLLDAVHLPADRLGPLVQHLEEVLAQLGDLAEVVDQPLELELDALRVVVNGLQLDQRHVLLQHLARVANVDGGLHLRRAK